MTCGDSSDRHCSPRVPVTNAEARPGQPKAIPLKISMMIDSARSRDNYVWWNVIGRSQ